MVKIANVEIKNFNKPYIVAEIGANHNGDVDIAKMLIKEAALAGCNAVKFQSWTKKSLFTKGFYNAHEKSRDKDFNNRNLEQMVELFQLDEKKHIELYKYAKEQNIEFLSTPLSRKEADFLDKLGVKAFKIASMDLNNYGFIEYIALKKKPLIISTGLSYLSEIEEAMRVIAKTGNKNVVLLHCNSLYPPKVNNINLKNIEMLRDLFGVPVGYSDHSIGISIALAAVGKGACLIERHFTLDKNMPGWDHTISSEPEEMKQLVKESERIALAQGSYSRFLTAEEEEKKKVFRRSIVAARTIKKGVVIKIQDLDFKRPGTGIEPKYIDFLLGKKAKRTIKEDDIIQRTDL